jgi:hydroxyethylthiazole kinase-like uncharacterized protein yjeF
MAAAGAAQAARSAREMAVLETNAVALGVTIDALMENAGRAVAEEAARRLSPPPAGVALVCGLGNNGGDGFSAAHYLGQWGYRPRIWVLRSPLEIRSHAARRCFDRVRSRFPVHVGAPRAADLQGDSLAIDAMLGTGQGGALRPPYLDAARAINESGIPILSIDVPSGLGSPDAVRPRWTVALTAPKDGMTPTNSGEVVVRDIGIPAEADRRTGPGEFHFFPVPGRAGRSGRSGRVLVVGGGPYAGAPALSALAALRAGAERATVLTPAPAADRVQGFSPDLVVHAVGEERFRPEDVEEILRLFGAMHVHAVLMGMGGGSEEATVRAFGALIQHWAGRVPLVVDAEALRALGRKAEPARGLEPTSVILTPNRGELARLRGGDLPEDPDAQRDAIVETARGLRATLLAKGEPDWISDGTRVYENTTHHVAMMVGGVGDVLDGVLGGLLAGGASALEAARLAPYWVGAAGNRAFEARSYGLRATDVIEELPGALADGLRRVAGTS